MQVNSVSQTTSTAAASGTSEVKTGTLDYDAFLTLLTAQLRNQDPTKPIDSTQYIAQLASFSNVEQSIKLNSKLDSLILANSLSIASDVVGKVVTSADGAVSGPVALVRIVSGGAVAVLENGQEVTLEAGITMRSL